MNLNQLITPNDKKEINISRVDKYLFLFNEKLKKSLIGQTSYYLIVNKLIFETLNPQEREEIEKAYTSIGWKNVKCKEEAAYLSLILYI